MTNRKIKVGLTHGDSNGVGYEIIIKLLEDPRLSELCTIVVYGSAKALSFYRKIEGLPAVQLQRCDSAANAVDGVYNIVNVVGEELKIEPGVPSTSAGEAAFLALEAAVADLRSGDIDVLVTAPIDKHSIQSRTFSFPGHTEYLESSLVDSDTPDEYSKALMILCRDEIRVCLATSHIPVSSVSQALSKESIFDKIERFNLSLKRDFGVHAPRIAVLALNPHAGDSGLLGKEEEEIISPAIAAAREKKIQVFGPYAADGFWGSGNYAHFDGILAMYHDQGLAPFKTLAMNAGVNFTAGLQYVRTSPDHGTGYDIAGKGIASPNSLRNAIYCAIDVYRNRAIHEEAFRHPLRRQFYEKDKTDATIDLSKEE